MKHLVVVNEKMLCSLLDGTVFRVCSQDKIEQPMTVLDVLDGADHPIGAIVMAQNTDRIRLAVKGDIGGFSLYDDNAKAVLAQHENRAPAGELCGILLQLREDFKQSAEQFRAYTDKVSLNFAELSRCRENEIVMVSSKDELRQIGESSESLSASMKELFNHMRNIDYDYQVIRGLLMSEVETDVRGLYTGDISLPRWTSMQIYVHNAESLAHMATSTLNKVGGVSAGGEPLF
ncbi:hypothetical protein JE959_001768 [Aeromonas veronii]|nr:hypothetical protein [Aeromonas veronii]